MEFDEVGQNVVDPEVRAHLYSLVSALGGTGTEESGRYILGDEALACLKDIKKWLKLYDDKLDRLDVARCLADARLVQGDLLEILASWEESNVEDRLRFRLCLASIEILVPLTWPLEKEDAQMTVNHHRHLPILRQTQAIYKRAILEHGSGRILRAAVRTALPSIAATPTDRTPRDEGIIKLVLYFIRNLVITTAPKEHSTEEQDGLISRSATIEAFHRQDVLALLLTLTSNIDEDFGAQDTVLLEILFHLLKGVHVESVFMTKEQMSSKQTDELKSLLAKEAHMHRDFAKTAPSRHNRFGTMVWVQRRGPGRHSTISGSDGLASTQRTLASMDASKKVKKAVHRGKNPPASLNERIDIPVDLTAPARRHLLSFVEEFLDSGFNPLFSHIRRAIEREMDRVVSMHHMQFFYVAGWFLQAERIRRKRAFEQKNTKKATQSFDADGFGLIASVLIQEFFFLLNRFMQKATELKIWHEVEAGMRCFTQILLIVQDMAASTLEEDREIADNILSRIFYEETTHLLVLGTLRDSKGKTFGYLDACTELAHTFLHILERYSKENLDLQVRSKRRMRRKQKKKQDSASTPDGPQLPEGEDESDDTDDGREAQRVQHERKFEFTRFASKFCTQNCIDTFIAFTRFYNDLRPDQLKRAHRFFYRIAFKQEMSIMLFRLDYLALFQKLVKGPGGLDNKCQSYREWEELVRQLLKILFKQLGKSPGLFVELLFTKLPSTLFYLQHGFEEPTVQTQPRQAPTLEVRGQHSAEDRIAIVVGVLGQFQNLPLVKWLVEKLRDAVDERQSFQAEAAARSQSKDNVQKVGDASTTFPSISIVAPNEMIRLAMIKNGHLQLLMTLCGIQKLEIADDAAFGARWLVPSSLSIDDMKRSILTLQEQYENPLSMFAGPDDEEARPVEEYVGRKKEIGQAAPVADSDDESEGADVDFNDFLFPAGGPTNTNMEARRDIALDRLKAKKLRGRREAESKGLSRADMEERKNARKLADLERRKAIKSELFVHESDEESDEERDRLFFAREEAWRQQSRRDAASTVSTQPPITSSLKRKDSESDSDGSKTDHDRKRHQLHTSSMRFGQELGSAAGDNSQSSESDSDTEETPSSSPPHTIKSDGLQGPAPVSEVGKLSVTQPDSSSQPDGTEGDDMLGSSMLRRRRQRATVFDDSDGE